MMKRNTTGIVKASKIEEEQMASSSWRVNPVTTTSASFRESM